MDTKTYLQSLLEKSSSYSDKQDDGLVIKKNGIESFIYAKLTSKKFRKTKMDPDCEKRTKNAIHLKVSKNEPITVLYPQGGYKLWRFPSSPATDWAEFFNISYLLQYVAPIASIYKPGVKIVYYTHTLLMELHDNLTKEEIQTYINSFQKLIDCFAKYLPKNVSISILRDADIYTRAEYFEALEKGKKQAEIDYQAWPQSKKDDFARMARLNIKWNGKEDWEHISNEEKEEKLYQAALYEMAATSNLERVFEKVKSPENVLVFTKATKDFIGIGSTRASSAKYWVGYGVLARNEEQFKPIVLTPSQYQTLKDEKPERVRVDLLSQPNFEAIQVYDTQTIRSAIGRK